jgi:hypothetical protein
MIEKVAFISRSGFLALQGVANRQVQRLKIGTPAVRHLSAAWAYYEQHREEGDRTIAALDEDRDG